MKKARVKIQKFIDKSERELAAIYFTLSNLAMLDVVPNDGDLRSMYRKADEIMSFECGSSIYPEYRTWAQDIDSGDSYCYDEWQKVRSKYVKEEVEA
jgi:hypothetical protein